MAAVVKFTLPYVDGPTSYVATLPKFPQGRPNGTPWGAASWLDPTANIANCPAVYDGFGFAVIDEAVATIGDGQKAGARPNDSAGALVGTKWVVTTPAASKTQQDLDDEAAAALAARKAVMVSQTEAKHSAMFAAGFTYRVPEGEAHTYQFDAPAQASMNAVESRFLAGASNAHGGVWWDIDNAYVTMSDAEVRTFFAATFAYGMQIIRRRRHLLNAIAAAANDTALDAINVAATHTSDPAQGWPS